MALPMWTNLQLVQQIYWSLWDCQPRLAVGNNKARCRDDIHNEKYQHCISKTTFFVSSRSLNNCFTTQISKNTPYGITNQACGNIYEGRGQMRRRERDAKGREGW